jgi:ethanolamine utilization protein EutQ (cupin superfamily)
MAQLIERPTVIRAAGNKPKAIAEYVGRVNTGSEALSIAYMNSPTGWAEPGQIADFDEHTVVLRGTLRVETAGGAIDVRAGQAVLARKGEWVRYSTPEGAEYVAVCAPAFAPERVRRDGDADAAADGGAPAAF